MASEMNRQDFLSERGRLIGAIAEVNQQIEVLKEEIMWAWRRGEPHDDLISQRSVHWSTKAALEDDLRALDARFATIDEQERAAEAAQTLPGREEAVARVESALAERARILRELQRQFEPIATLVQDFEDISLSLRAVISANRGYLGDDTTMLCRTINERHHEAQLVSGMLHGTGLWGAGKREDYFKLQDWGVDNYARMMANSILGRIRKCLLTEKED